MLPPEICRYLHDMLQACNQLQDFTADKNVDDYKSDPMLRAAVERQ